MAPATNLVELNGIEAVGGGNRSATRRPREFKTRALARLTLGHGASRLPRGMLRELITVEAKGIELSFDEAVRAAQEGTLPSGSLFASDIAFLVDLLPHAVRRY